MSLREMKDDLHDGLWNAMQRWFALRDQGETKHGLKMAGLRDAKDLNHYTRGLIFTGATRVTYERDLKGLLHFAHERFGVQNLKDITEKHARAYLERGIELRWTAKTLHKTRSELAKLGALIGKTASFAALSKTYGAIIRGLTGDGVIEGPTRATPSKAVVERAIEILRERDAKHPGRAYHLAARLQLETGARRISVTERFTRESLKEGAQVEIVGKGGKVQLISITAELHQALRHHFTKHDGALADPEGFRMAYARAVETARGRVAGTHGMRRLAAQRYYAERYRERQQRGEPPGKARAGARQDVVERLGHGRDRVDQANAYLGKSA